MPDLALSILQNTDDADASLARDGCIPKAVREMEACLRGERMRSGDYLLWYVDKLRIGGVVLLTFPHLAADNRAVALALKGFLDEVEAPLLSAGPGARCALDEARRTQFIALLDQFLPWLRTGVACEHVDPHRFPTAGMLLERLPGRSLGVLCAAVFRLGGLLGAPGRRLQQQDDLRTLCRCLLEAGALRMPRLRDPDKSIERRRHVAGQYLAETLGAVIVEGMRQSYARARTDLSEQEDALLTALGQATRMLLDQMNQPANLADPAFLAMKRQWVMTGRV